MIVFRVVSPSYCLLRTSPAQIFEPMKLENVRSMESIKCLRLLRLGKAFRFNKILRVMESAWKFLAVIKVVLLFLSFAVFAHWVACGWALINMYNPG